MSNNGSSPLVLWYNQLGMQDVERVGGKNASLGEMIKQPLWGAGVSVPGGFATTAFAFNEFLESSGLNGKIHDLLDNLDVDDMRRPQPRSGQADPRLGDRSPVPAGTGAGHPRRLRTS
ncbi:PEP/pyruvate-binding domain-containing protein [Escherichia coli]